jgi:hypothetical protein
MRGAAIHGVLLVVMLVYGYRTWTRDQTIKPDLGSVVLWEKAEADLASIELKSDKQIVRLERRGQGADAYWWGLQTTIEKKAKPPEPAKPGAGSGSAAGSGAGSAAGSGAGSAAGSGAGSGSAAAPAPAEEEIRKTHEFPLGELAEKLVKDYASAHALRDLGTPNDEQKKDYKLNDAKTTLTVTFKDGPRSFLVGGSVYGGSDRYVADTKTHRAYVLSKDLISNLEIGESSLHLVEARGFDVAKIEQITIEGDGKSKTAARVVVPGPDGQQQKKWGDPETKKADDTVGNFIDNTNNLRPTEYLPDVKVNDLKQVLKLTYKDAGGRVLGTLTLYKYEKPGELAPGAELDPANPPKGETEYAILTEKTRIPAVVRRDTAQRTEQDIATVFSDHPASIEPKGNPFQNTPLPANPHGGHAGSGSAAPAAGSGAGSSAAPAAGAGSAAQATPPKSPAPPAAGPAKKDRPAAGGW